MAIIIMLISAFLVFCFMLATVEQAELFSKARTTKSRILAICHYTFGITYIFVQVAIIYITFAIFSAII